MPVDYSSQIDALCSTRDNEKKAQSGLPQKHWYDGFSLKNIFPSSTKPVTVQGRDANGNVLTGGKMKGGKRKSRKGSKKAARKSKKSRR